MYRSSFNNEDYFQHKSSDSKGFISVAEYKRKFKATCLKNRRKRKNKKK